jgi:dihydroflavonol-4-reductase
VDGVEGLYHLAAVYAVWTKDPTLQYKVNVEGANAMLRAAMDAGVKKVVFTSSVAAIGVNSSGELANEDTVFNGWEYGNDYVLSKYMSHQMVKGLVSEGLPAVLVCPGFPFGPGDRMPTPTGKLIVAIIKGEMKNYFEGGACAVDVRDVAKGHLLAMQKGRIGESYLLANKNGNLSQKDLARMVGRIANVPDVATKEVPSWVMKLVARAMETWANITGKTPLTTYKTSMFAMQHVFVDPSKAVDELGLPQTPIETAIEDAVLWFRENGYDKK